ncbi:MAG: hypothetical protein KH452_11170 [Clostridiales bacterium]|nr:hypothetical protein [Clostridiales bacterium]
MNGVLYYKRSLTPAGCLILFFAGLLAGILFVQTQEDAVFAGIFSEYFLNQYASLKIDHKKLMWYVSGCRLGQYALLVCCGALTQAPLIIRVLIFGLGMTWGTMTSISTLRLGFRGMVICVAGVMPQMFFYLPAFGWILIWIWKQGYSRKKYFFLAVAGFFFLIFGIITEVYLNPLILQQILRKM